MESVRLLHPRVHLQIAAAVAMAFLLVTSASAQDHTLRAPWGFDPADMDSTATPCEDFFQFANGGWMARNPIPPDRTSWSSYTEALGRTEHALRAIAETAVRRGSGTSDPVEQRVGRVYATCMDTTAAEAMGSEPIRPLLTQIKAISNRAELVHELASLHARGLYVAFYYGPGSDPNGASTTIGELWQNGIGLPTPDDYFSASGRPLLEAYRRHLIRLFCLIDPDSNAAIENADRSLALESALGSASMGPLELRDPAATVHLKRGSEFESAAPRFDWAHYFDVLGAPRPDRFNLGQPRFFQTLDSLFADAPLAEWKSYLAARVLRDASPYLSSEFRSESRAFAKLLGGAESDPPRWRFCLDAVDEVIGPGFGVLYADRNFPPEAESRAREMIDNLLAALRKRLVRIAWMGTPTRRSAIAKVDSMTILIGKPKTIPDYAQMSLPNGSLYQQLLAGAAFHVRKELAKIGSPEDKAEWSAPAYHISGYYNPARNVLVYPAAKFQLPFYHKDADPAVNYGAIGATIGHEILHALDDQGRQYDAGGGLRDWWSPRDEMAFLTRAQTLVKQFSEYPYIDSLHVDGRLTLGENIADLGGLTVSLAGLQRALSRSGRRQPIDGWTPEQRFFLSWARNWRGHVRPERARVLQRRDPHSPAKWRTNGPLSNLPEFGRAFGCGSSDPMVRSQAERVAIW